MSNVISMSTNFRAPKFGSIEAGLEPIQLGVGNYKFVKIQVRLTNSDGTANDAGNVVFGDAQAQTFELVSGQASEFISLEGVGGLEGFYLRVLPGGLSNTCTVAYRAADKAE